MPRRKSRTLTEVELESKQIDRPNRAFVSMPWSRGAFLRRVEAVLSDRRPQVRRPPRAALLGTLLIAAASLALAPPVGDRSEDHPAAAPATRPATEPAGEDSAATAARVRELAGRLKGGDARKRVSAAFELGRAGPQAAEAAGALVEALREARRPAGRGRDEAGLTDAAMVALMRIGEGAFPAVEGLLKDKDERLRIDAVMILGRCGNSLGRIGERILTGIDPRVGPALPEAMPLLLRAMKDPSQAVRWWAGVAMANVRPEPVHSMRDIAAGLKDRSVDVRVQFAKTLAGFGPAAAPAAEDLTAALGDKEERVRTAACGTLVKIGAKAVGPLMAVLDGQDRQRQVMATSALAGIGEPAVLPLAAALKHDSVGVRRLAAGTLGAIGPAAAGATMQLAEAVKDPDRELAAGAAEALGKTGPAAAGATPALAEALKGRLDRRLVAENAKGSLRKMGPAAVGAIPELVKLLDHEDEHYRLYGDVGVRLDAMDVLASMGPAAKAAVPALHKALNVRSVPNSEGAHRPVQWHAADALGAIGPAAGECLDDLLAIVKDPKAYFFVRQQAAMAAARIAPADGRVVQALMVALKDKDTARGAVWALGLVGPAAREAIPALEARAREAETPDARKAAEDALKNIRGGLAPPAGPPAPSTSPGSSTRPAGDGKAARPGAKEEEMEAAVDAKSGKVIAFWVQYQPSQPERAVLVKEPYGVLVVWGGYGRRFFLYDNARKRVFATGDFEAFLRRLDRLPQECRAQQIEKCSAPFAYEMPPADYKRLSDVLTRGKRTWVRRPDDPGFELTCTCESTGLRFPGERAARGGGDDRPCRRRDGTTQPTFR